MSRGIARSFRERFGGIEELITLNATIGDTVKLTRDDRNVFYLITKEKYFHKPILLSGSGSLWKYVAGISGRIFPYEASDNNITYSNKTLPHI